MKKVGKVAFEGIRISFTSLSLSVFVSHTNPFSVTRLDDFSKFLATNLLTKVVQKDC